MNLAHIIDGHDADSVALISAGREVTYRELADHIDRFRGGLASLGIGDGDRVALLCGNGAHFVVAYFAALGLGAAVVPLNPLSPAPELTNELASVEAKAVVVEKLSAATWSNVDRSAVPSVEIVIGVEGAAISGDMHSFEDLQHVDAVPVVDVDDDHTAALIFTSGTAGLPRAAVLTHGNLLAPIQQNQATGNISDDDLIYCVLPLFHIFGLNLVMTLGLARGATVLLVQRFDPQTAAESISARGVTVVPGAPAMWGAFAHFDELPDDSFASVRVALSGASRLPMAVFTTIRTASVSRSRRVTA